MKQEEGASAPPSSTLSHFLFQLSTESKSIILLILFYNKDKILVNQNMEKNLQVSNLFLIKKNTLLTISHQELC